MHLHVCRRTYLPMMMEQTECSKTSAYKFQTPRNHPKESIQHSIFVQIITATEIIYCSIFEAMLYKPEGHGFDSRWCHWNFHLNNPSDRGADSAYNRNEYQEYFRREGGKGGQCIELTTLPPSCADCLEIWKPQPPGTLRTCPGL